MGDNRNRSVNDRLNLSIYPPDDDDLEQETKGRRNGNSGNFHFRPESSYWIFYWLLVGDDFDGVLRGVRGMKRYTFFSQCISSSTSASSGMNYHQRHLFAVVTVDTILNFAFLKRVVEEREKVDTKSNDIRRHTDGHTDNVRRTTNESQDEMALASMSFISLVSGKLIWKRFESAENSSERRERQETQERFMSKET